jgi:phosphatidylserine decarboxylase
MTTPRSRARSDGGGSRPHPVAARLFAALQHLLPQHAMSAVVHRAARIRRGPVKTALIAAFVRAFKPEMVDAFQANPFEYESFNALFTRSLNPAARPVDPDPGSIVSPVDGTVSQIGALDGLTLIQAKGRTYRLDALLARDGCATRFAGGSFATLYLAPCNYHRIHMPTGARLTAAWYVPGRLFSVNTATASAVANLFARNERVVCLFETARGSSFAMVLVGALFVGSIATRWHGEVAPRRPRKALDLPVPADATRLDKGDEMGRFNMGSTVILIFPRDDVSWAAQLGPGSRIVMGQRLGRFEQRT